MAPLTRLEHVVGAINIPEWRVTKGGARASKRHETYTRSGRRPDRLRPGHRRLRDGRGDVGRRLPGERRETTGRNHHIETFTMWLAGGGVKPGVTIGATDELGFSPVEDRIHVHDLQATILHLLGLDHLRLTFRFQGRDFRLTDVGGEVVRKVLA